MTELEFLLDNGMRIAAHAYGDPSHAPVLLSHGGGQTRHSWGATAERLSHQGWYAVAYDHRGHGNSGWSEDGDYEIERFIEDQRLLAGSFEQKPVVVGASLGGITAMLTEGESPETTFRAIVLVDIAPQMSHEGASGIIAFMGTHVEDGFSCLEEAADVIAEYTGRPRRKDLSGLRKNLRLDDDGRYRWHWDPRFVSDRHSPEGFTGHRRMEDAVDNIALPMMLVRGQMSNLVTEEIAAAFLAQKPDAEYVDVANAHHMVAGDRNDIFTDAVADFLSRVPH